MRKQIYSLAATAAMLSLPSVQASAAIEGSLDPESVVEQWSDDSTYPLVFDINFSDTSWPDTWTKETGRDCPEWADGGYVNAVLDMAMKNNTTPWSRNMLRRQAPHSDIKVLNQSLNIT